MAKSYAVTFLGGPKDPTSVFVVPGVALDRAEDLELPKGKAVEVPKTVLEKVRTIANRVQYRHTLDFDFDEDYEAPKPAPVRRREGHYFSRHQRASRGGSRGRGRGARSSSRRDGAHDGCRRCV
jgi:hypothetical protein